MQVNQLEDYSNNQNDNENSVYRNGIRIEKNKWI